MARLLPLLLLCGCLGHVTFPGATMLPPMQVLDVSDAWKNAGLPWDADCESKLAGLPVLVDDAQVETICRRPVCNATDSNGFCAQSCFGYVAGDLFTAGSSVIVVGAHWNQPGNYAHEALHFFSYCETGDADYTHGNVTVWGSPFQSPASLLHKLGG